MNEDYEKKCRDILNGRVSLSDIPLSERLQNHCFYAYAYRFARGCPNPADSMNAVHTLLESDIKHCSDNETAADLQELLSHYNV